jgi:hypothetical protein
MILTQFKRPQRGPPSSAAPVPLSIDRPDFGTAPNYFGDFTRPPDPLVQIGHNPIGFGHSIGTFGLATAEGSREKTTEGWSEVGDNRERLTTVTEEKGDGASSKGPVLAANRSVGSKEKKRNTHVFGMERSLMSDDSWELLGKSGKKHRKKKRVIGHKASVDAPDPRDEEDVGVSVIEEPELIIAEERRNGNIPELEFTRADDDWDTLNVSVKKDGKESAMDCHASTFEGPKLTIVVDTSRWNIPAGRNAGEERAVVPHLAAGASEPRDERGAEISVVEEPNATLVEDNWISGVPTEKGKQKCTMDQQVTMGAIGLKDTKAFVNGESQKTIDKAGSDIGGSERNNELTREKREKSVPKEERKEPRVGLGSVTAEENHDQIGDERAAAPINKGTEESKNDIVATKPNPAVEKGPKMTLFFHPTAVTVNGSIDNDRPVWGSPDKDCDDKGKEEEARVPSSLLQPSSPLASTSTGGNVKWIEDTRAWLDYQI